MPSGAPSRPPYPMLERTTTPHPSQVRELSDLVERRHAQSEAQHRETREAIAMVSRRHETLEQEVGALAAAFRRKALGGGGGGGGGGGAREEEGSLLPASRAKLFGLELRGESNRPLQDRRHAYEDALAGARRDERGTSAA